jgi:hypothetical protein
VYAASSDCVVVLVLGDLVAWRHSVRASIRGRSAFYYQVSRVYNNRGIMEMKNIIKNQERVILEQLYPKKKKNEV